MPLLFIGPQEIIIIGLIVVVIFGAKKLPQLGAGLGQGIRNFKESITGKEEEKKMEKPAEEREQPQ